MNEEKAQETTAPESNEQMIPLKELEEFRASSQKQIQDLQEENRKIVKAMEGYKAQAKAKEQKTDDADWEGRIQSLEKEYGEKLSSITSRFHETQRRATENDLKAALSQAGAVDPEYLLYQARKNGLIEEKASDSGDLNIILRDLTGRHEIRESDNFRPVSANNLARSMRESGKFDSLFKSDRPAGHGVNSTGTAQQQNEFQRMYENEMNGSRNPFKLTKIQQAAAKNGIKIKT